jgi:hypothetical protein
MAHTPGPWRIGDAGHTIFGPPNGSPCPEIIAHGLTKANARLIASAPELLIECQEGLFIARAYRALCAKHGAVPKALNRSIESIAATLARATETPHIPQG